MHSATSAPHRQMFTRRCSILRGLHFIRVVCCMCRPRPKSEMVVTERLLWQKAPFYSCVKGGNGVLKMRSTRLYYQYFRSWSCPVKFCHSFWRFIVNWCVKVWNLRTFINTPKTSNWKHVAMILWLKSLFLLFRLISDCLRNQPLWDELASIVPRP